MSNFSLGPMFGQQPNQYGMNWGQSGFQAPELDGFLTENNNILQGVDAAGGGAGIMDQFKQFMLGKTNADGTKEGGWGGLALNAGLGLANTWMGMKQYGLAKDSLRENKRQFDLNYGAQRNMTNSQLSDRQNARMSATRGQGTQDTASYMKQWGV